MRVEGINSLASVRRAEPIGRENAGVKNGVAENNAQKSQRNFNKASEGDLIAAIESANKHFEVYDKRLEFSIHEKTKEIMVKVIDSTNDEVIREIPSEKILDMIANMMELAGILVDEKA